MGALTGGGADDSNKAESETFWPGTGNVFACAAGLCCGEAAIGAAGVGDDAAAAAGAGDGASFLSGLA